MRNRTLTKKTKSLNRSQIKPEELQTRERKEKPKKEKKKRKASFKSRIHNFKIWGP